MRSIGRFLVAAALLGAPVAANASGAAERERAPAPPAAGPQRAASVLRFDFNHNGQIDPAEREAIRAELRTKRELHALRLLAKYDRDRDGRLDDAETQAMKDERAREAAAMHARTVARNDANGDGRLDAAETQAMRERHRQFLAQMHAAYVRQHDTNGDGILDGAEQAAIDQAQLAQLRAITGKAAGGVAARASLEPVTAPGGGLSKVIVTPTGGAQGWNGVDVRFTLGRPADVTVRVFDAGGRLVRVAAKETQEAGARSVHWDGRSDAGRAVPNGLYFVTVEALGNRVNLKVAVLR